MNPVIILENISVRYRAQEVRIRTFKEYAIQLLKRNVRFKEFRALNHVNLQVNEGEIVGVIGRNGAGKSTLGKILAGVYSPDTGEIRLEGKAIHPVNPMAARRLGIAMVHQHFTLVPNLSILENVVLGDHARFDQLPAKLQSDPYAYGPRQLVTVPPVVDTNSPSSSSRRIHSRRSEAGAAIRASLRSGAPRIPAEGADREIAEALRLEKIAVPSGTLKSWWA